MSTFTSISNRSNDDARIAEAKEQIRAMLTSNPGMTDKHLRMSLSIDRRILRLALHTSNDFEAADGHIPRWYLRGHAPAKFSADLSNRDLTDREVLLDTIAEIVAHQPGTTAKEMVKILGLEKGSINSALYSTNRFTYLPPNPPRWFLASSAEVIEEEVEQLHFTEGLSLSADWYAQIEADLESAFDDYDEGEAIVIGATTIAPAPVVDVAVQVVETADDAKVPFAIVKRSTTPRVATPIVEPTAENPFALYDWQLAALDLWTANGGQGIIDAVTGAGKTRLAIAAIGAQLDENGKAVVVVPTITLLHQWYVAIQEFLPEVTIGLLGGGYGDELEDVDVLVATIASARKATFSLQEGESGLLVVDECHRAASEVNRFALDERFERRLGLSATHERMDDLHKEVLIPYFHGVVYTLAYRDAIEAGVIANVRVAFVGVEFTDEEGNLYAEMTDKLTALRRRLVNHFGCRPAPFSAFLDDVLARTRMGDRQEGMVANLWLTNWRRRRELLAETPAKLDALTSMTDAIKQSVGTMVFTQSIASANAIVETLNGLGIPTGVHHSDVASQARAQVLEDFGDRKLKTIVSVQTLEEGVDVPDADLAIIVAASKQRRQMIQRMGRIMRQKADGRDARFIILFVNDTDEDPGFGGNELFIEELVEVAREADLYTLPNDEDEFTSFLDPGRMI